MITSGRHVISGLRGGWRVRMTGAHKATRVFPTREEAIAFARAETRREGGDLFIHNDDGTVDDVRTYERRVG
ncbi:DUF2188 domain-containing protein [Brevundimonas sp.]|uniref:DUF2188 domain-containing protein n=1 Tax=Brevundimonas sp. TaxID=1871086 RepID=UPI002737A492|nr:DUF2188 domain-containing protein [Brevundimonas sp.]MDP3800952.1 DUF2188 domain-containing protein [Brevundimonas sp.]